MKFLEQLFDEKIVRILQVFFSNEEKEFYQREIANMTGVSAATTHRIINRLVGLKLIDEVQIKKLKLYKLSNSPNVAYLKPILKKDMRVVEEFVNLLKQRVELQQVILHGREGKTKSNLLLIGDNIDHNTVKQLSAEFEQKHRYRISALTLTKEQYEQMSSMGLYSGEKKVLY